MYRINNESERLPEAIRYVKKMVETIDFQLNELNFSEDVNGKLYYNDKADYREEREELENKRMEWNDLLYLLTAEAPASVLGD